MASLPRILEYISRDSLQRMFADPSAGGYVCSSILRLLDASSEDNGVTEAVAKSYVMRMLFISSPVPLSTCQGVASSLRCRAVSLLIGWVAEGCTALHTQALSLLVRLGIMDTCGHDGSLAYVLHSSFRDSLVRFLCRPQEPWIATSDRENLSEGLSRDVVEESCRQVWESILRFLVGAGQVEVPNTVRNFMVRTELMVPTSEERSKKLAISARGYEYLLKDQREQAWVFVSEALRIVKHDGQREDILALILTLSHCSSDRPYPMEAATPLQRQMLFELSHFGIIHLPSLQSNVFYPTKLATSLLTQGLSGETDIDTSRRLSSERHISVIAETNFQVLAYVTSELYLAILRIFVEINILLPNAILGRITRAKSKEAFNRGITSSQIMHFLTAHAHPKVKDRVDVVPANVRAQLLLWEKERERVNLTEAVLIDFAARGYAGATQFPTMLNHAKTLAVCLWVDEKALKLAVTEEGYSKLEEVAMNLGFQLP